MRDWLESCRQVYNSAMMGFKSFNTASLTLKGIEAMNWKGQIQTIEKGNVLG
jgi:hypothetical protein